MGEPESLQAVLNKASLTSPTITGGFIPDSVGVAPLVGVPQAVNLDARYLDDVNLVYRDPSPLLSGTITLLSDAIQLCSAALDAQEQGELLSSDDCMQRVQAILDPLFAYRELGSGYAVIVNALHYSFVNAHGEPLSRQQILAVRQILRQVRSYPFMSVDRAAEATDALEDAGFTTDPAILSLLLSEAEECGLAGNE